LNCQWLGEGCETRKIMPMTVDDILVHPALEPRVRGQAQSLLLIQEASPRIASLFATQQRWLMAHAALAQYFRSEAKEAGAGLLAERFLESVERHTLASRNTAAAFLKEMLKYDIVRFVENSEGKRQRPLMPAPTVLMALFHWHALHLATLDGLDDGTRAASFRARPALLGEVQPLIADGLIGSGEVREPEKTFSLFTWINEGGLVMDRLIAGCQQAAEGLARIPTDVTSVSGLRSTSICREPSSGVNLPRPRRWEAWAGPGSGENLRYGYRRTFGANIMPRRR
jgi:hypothetical protein